LTSKSVFFAGTHVPRAGHDRRCTGCDRGIKVDLAQDSHARGFFGTTNDLRIASAEDDAAGFVTDAKSLGGRVAVGRIVLQTYQ